MASMFSPQEGALCSPAIYIKNYNDNFVQDKRGNAWKCRNIQDQSAGAESKDESRKEDSTHDVCGITLGACDACQK